ncbi:MAG: hypothetical protein DRP62_01725, partial [Planctomycetota bacterium]
MHTIWAVATNTIKQALRMKVAVVFIILLVILLPAMGSVMTGDGTIKGRLQTFVSYGLSLTGFLLCLLTIAVSVYSMTSDLEQKQIYTVLTKPVHRFQLILGKLLGVVLLDVVLLVLFSAVIYAVTIYMPRFFDASEAELVRAENEFFTARASLTPAEEDVTKEVELAYEKLERAGQLPPGVPRSKIISQLTSQKKLQKRAAVVGQELAWEFNNVKLIEPARSLFVRFKYSVSVNPPDSQVFGRWDIGDYRQLEYGKIETPIYRFDRKDPARTFCEIEVPADAVAKDGYLAVRFLNVPLNSTVVIFPPKDGLEVLYKADTFTANFIRAVFLILFRLIFLAVLGILASTFLSFPVAILLCLVIFFTGSISGFILESFSFLGEGISGFYSYTVEPIIKLLP